VVLVLEKFVPLLALEVESVRVLLKCQMIITGAYYA
jgi:hypothetical protein